MIEQIIKLWNECHNIKDIALKLGLYDPAGELDTEYVEMVVDDPANYCCNNQKGGNYESNTR